MSTTRKEQKRASQLAYIQAKKDADEEIKQIGCQACHGDLPAYCLDFHHTEDKDKCIADMTIHNILKLTNELCKCVLVCSNCHRQIHRGDIKCPSELLNKDFVTPILIKHKSKVYGISHKTFEFQGRTCIAKA